MNESRPSLLPNLNFFLPRNTNHRIMELPLHARLGFGWFGSSIPPPSCYKQEYAKFVGETSKRGWGPFGLFVPDAAATDK